MWKSPRFVLLVALLLLTGCRIFHTSEVQRTVSRARHDASAADSVGAIHEALLRTGVEHKIVHFRYEVTARPLEAPLKNFTLGETTLAFLPHRVETTVRRGIVFRDDSDPVHPWWYMDKNNRRWLPNGSAEGQLRFAVRQRVELLRVEDFDRSSIGMTKDAVPAVSHSAMKLDWNARFRRLHGTDYNPHSSVDTAKMRVLRER